MNDFCVVTQDPVMWKMEEIFSKIHSLAFKLRQEHQVHDSLKPREVQHNIL